jgi:hypothetical protein
MGVKYSLSQGIIMKIQQADATWRNWSGSQYSSPQIFEPKEIMNCKIW